MPTAPGVSRKSNTVYDSKSFTQAGLMKGDVVFANGTKMTDIPQPAHDLAANGQQLFLILTTGGDVRIRLRVMHNNDYHLLSYATYD